MGFTEASVATFSQQYLPLPLILLPSLLHRCISPVNLWANLYLRVCFQGIQPRDVDTKSAPSSQTLKCALELAHALADWQGEPRGWWEVERQPLLARCSNIITNLPTGGDEGQGTGGWVGAAAQESEIQESLLGPV